MCVVTVHILEAATLIVCLGLQLEQDLANPSSGLNAAAAYEDVLALLRNTGIR